MNTNTTNVLLVEDKPLTTLVESKLFSDLGCIVDHVDDSQQAYEVVTAHYDRYQLILIDLGYLKTNTINKIRDIRMFGYGLLSLNNFHYRTPIIVTVKDIDMEEVKNLKMFMFGIDEVVIKPITYKSADHILSSHSISQNTGKKFSSISQFDLGQVNYRMAKHFIKYKDYFNAARHFHYAIQGEIFIADVDLLDGIENHYLLDEIDYTCSLAREILKRVVGQAPTDEQISELENVLLNYLYTNYPLFSRHYVYKHGHLEENTFISKKLETDDKKVILCKDYLTLCSSSLLKEFIEPDPSRDVIENFAKSIFEYLDHKYNLNDPLKIL